jgi:hypothetical protein
LADFPELTVQVAVTVYKENNFDMKSQTQSAFSGPPLMVARHAVANNAPDSNQSFYKD